MAEPDWWETWLLASELVNDPSSHIATAIAGWSRPWPVEAWLLADLYDLTARANAKRGSQRRPYPRPNDKQPRRIGRATRPQADIRAALAARGHTIVGGS